MWNCSLVRSFLFLSLIFNAHSALDTIPEDERAIFSLRVSPGLAILSLNPAAATDDSLYEFAPLFEKFYEGCQRKHGLEGHTDEVLHHIPHRTDLQKQCCLMKVSCLLYDALTYGEIFNTLKGITLKVKTKTGMKEISIPDNWKDDDNFLQLFLKEMAPYECTI